MKVSNEKQANNYQGYPNVRIYTLLWSTTVILGVKNKRGHHFDTKTNRKQI